MKLPSLEEIELSWGQIETVEQTPTETKDQCKPHNLPFQMPGTVQPCRLYLKINETPNPIKTLPYTWSSPPGTGWERMNHMRC